MPLKIFFTKSETYKVATLRCLPSFCLLVKLAFLSASLPRTTKTRSIIHYSILTLNYIRFL